MQLLLTIYELRKVEIFFGETSTRRTMSYLQSVTGSIASSPGRKHICGRRGATLAA